jgi:hypothetical protein
MGFSKRYLLHAVTLVQTLYVTEGRRQTPSIFIAHIRHASHEKSEPLRICSKGKAIPVTGRGSP